VSSRRVLILGGEGPAVAKLRLALQGRGYDVASLPDGGDGWDLPDAGTGPDLVLLEGLAGGGADDARERVAALGRRWQAPVLLLASEPEAVGLDTALPDPHGCLVRPFTPRELQLSVELALGRHAAEGAVRETEDRFFDNAIDLLCFLDFSGYFRRLNPAWERTLGFTVKELMSRPFIEFVHPEDRQRTLEQNARVRGGGQARAFENRYLCRDGSYRWFRWNATPDSSARVIYSVARDITEARQAEEERERLVEELQKALAEVSTLRKILPICSYCRKIRDDENYWHTVETYIARHTDTRFSHGICPNCAAAEFEAHLGERDDG
jgi:PAS domain S-box-containing protein